MVAYLTVTEKLVMSIQLETLGIFGTLGNGLVVYVYTAKRDKPAWAIFILYLAWCDFFTCLVVMPFTLVAELLDYRLVYDVVCKVYHFLITCNVPLSTFIMTAIAVDRYFSICHPFLHVMTPHRARITVLCLCTFTFFVGTVPACLHGVYDLNTVTFPPPCTTSMNTTTAILFGNNHPANKQSIHQPLGQGVLGPHDSIVNNTDKTESVVTDTVRSSLWHGDDGDSYDSIFDSSNDNTSSNSSNNNSDSNDANDIHSQQGNLVSSLGPVCTPVTEKRHVYNEGGYCNFNTVILPYEVFNFYQKIYTSFFLICVLAVFTLYSLIYRKVLKARAWRSKHSHFLRTAKLTSTPARTTRTKPAMVTTEDRRQHPNADEDFTAVAMKCKNKKPETVEKKQTCDRVTGSDISRCKKALTFGREPSDNYGGACTSATNGTSNTNTNIATRNSTTTNSSAATSPPTTISKKPSPERMDLNTMANIRTAFMLFVVTVVFIITFLPSCLMALRLIDHVAVIFYIYFVNNVANPVIYAFMNQSFRNDLKHVFKRGHHFFRRG